MPLSRPGFLEAGRHLKAGLELAVADVNGLGGVGGLPLRLLVRDTGAGPADAVAIVDELDEVGVAAIAGEYHSVVARAIAVRATQIGLAFVCSSAVLDSLTDEPSGWVARLAPAQSHCWRAYAEFLVGAGYRRVALIAQPDRYWSAGAGILRAALGEAGVGVVTVDASASDAAGAAAQLAEIGGIAAAVLLVAYPEPAASLVRAFRASGAFADMAIGDPAGRAEFSGWSQVLGVDGLGVSFLRYLPGRLDGAGKAIERRLTEVLGEVPSFIALEAYDAISVVAAALRAGGCERPALAASFADLTVAGTRGQIRFTRVPGVSVWQWAWPPIQVAARVQMDGPRAIAVLREPADG
jgi:ABC-type branched-subunit amino acid transport system substrate-binding protein